MKHLSEQDFLAAANLKDGATLLIDRQNKTVLETKTVTVEFLTKHNSERYKPLDEIYTHFEPQFIQKLYDSILELNGKSKEEPEKEKKVTRRPAKKETIRKPRGRKPKAKTPEQPKDEVKEIEDKNE